MDSLDPSTVLVLGGLAMLMLYSVAAVIQGRGRSKPSTRQARRPRLSGGPAATVEPLVSSPPSQREPEPSGQGKDRPPSPRTNPLGGRSIARARNELEAAEAHERYVKAEPEFETEAWEDPRGRLVASHGGLELYERELSTSAGAFDVADVRAEVVTAQQLIRDRHVTSGALYEGTTVDGIVIPKAHVVREADLYLIVQTVAEAPGHGFAFHYSGQEFKRLRQLAAQINKAAANASKARGRRELASQNRLARLQARQQEAAARTAAARAKLAGLETDPAQPAKADG